MSRRFEPWAAFAPALATLSLWATARAQEPPTYVTMPGQPVTAGIIGSDPASLPPEALDGEVHVIEPGGIVLGSERPCGCAGCQGKLYRLGYKIGFCLRDNVIGYPQYFQEPALGRALYNNMGRQTAKGDVHTYTLYRSDFIAGTARLSPGGARRLSFLASRIDRWAGPVVVEWTPDEPPLGMARRDAVATLLAEARIPLEPGRVVVGPSAFRGMIGPEAGNNHDTLIFRDYTAPRSFSVTPTSTAEFGGGSR